MRRNTYIMDDQELGEPRMKRELLRRKRFPKPSRQIAALWKPQLNLIQILGLVTFVEHCVGALKIQIHGPGLDNAIDFDVNNETDSAEVNSTSLLQIRKSMER